MPRNVDLNLLGPLQALLEERSVTRAAVLMGVSQPAMSASLAKLRRHFQDELLVRNGNVHELTPLADELLEPTATALRAVRQVFTHEGEFDPSTSERDFTVVMSDYATAVLGSVVSRRIRTASPGSRLLVQGISPHVVDTAPDSLRSRDLLVMPHGFLSGLPHRDLYEENWVCLVATRGASVDRLTVGDLARRPWATTFHQPTAFTTAVQQLRMQGIEPRVEVVTEDYLTLGVMIADTDRIALVQERLGRLLAANGGVRTMPCPFPVAPLVEAMWWHPAYTNDRAHLWLREIFVAAGIEIT